jgi:hypothetical protein
VLGDHSQQGGRAAADNDRRVGSLDGLGVAERSGEVDVAAIEVERLGLGPQPPDDRARLGEAPTEWAKSSYGRPWAAYSRRASGWLGREPAPIPKSSRPPETMSTVVAILASIAGGRNRLLVTSRPRRSRRVCAAIAESRVQPSKIGPSGSPPIGMR